jgi:hypothetical protein
MVLRVASLAAVLQLFVVSSSFAAVSVHLSVFLLCSRAPALAPEDLSELQLQQLMASAAVSGSSEHAAHSSHSQQQRILPIDSAMEQEALDRVRMSVSYHQHRLPPEQHAAVAGSRGYGSDAGVSQLLEDEHEDGGDEDDADSLQDAEQIAEVLAAIEQQQRARLQQASAAGAGEAAASAADAEPGTGDDGSSWQQPSEEASLPADPWDMSDGEWAAVCLLFARSAMAQVQSLQWPRCKVCNGPGAKSAMAQVQSGNNTVITACLKLQAHVVCQ